MRLPTEDVAAYFREGSLGGFHIEFADDVAWRIEAVLPAHVQPWAEVLDFQHGVDAFVGNVHHVHLHADAFKLRDRLPKRFGESKAAN